MQANGSAALAACCADETAANRRMAKELIERWSRPILAPRAGAGIDSEEQQRILEARQARQQRLAEQVAAAAAEAGGAGVSKQRGNGAYGMCPAVPVPCPLQRPLRLPWLRAWLTGPR